MYYAFKPSVDHQYPSETKKILFLNFFFVEKILFFPKNAIIVISLQDDCLDQSHPQNWCQTVDSYLIPVVHQYNYRYTTKGSFFAFFVKIFLPFLLFFLFPFFCLQNTIISHFNLSVPAPPSLI